MKRLLLIALLSCPSLTWAGTWALLHNSVNTGCSSGSATCVVTVTSTGSANLLVAVSTFGNQTDTLTAGSGGGTWVAALTGCKSSDSGRGTGIDMAYVLSSTSGTTSITITKSSTSNSWATRILEYTTTAGPAVFDVCGNRDQTTTTASPAGVTLTLSGSNDVIVQSINGSTPTAIGSPYTDPATFSGANGYGGSINTASGTAPTWTQTASRAVLSAIAFQETTGGAVVRHRAEVIQ